MLRHYVALIIGLAVATPTIALADGPTQAPAATPAATTAPADAAAPAATPAAQPAAPADPNAMEGDDQQEPGAASLSDEQAIYQENTGVERNDDLNPHENEGDSYFFLGAMYRQIWVPPQFQRLFIDGGIAVFNPGAGLEFTYRKNNFSIGANVWWQDLRFVGPFRASGDPEQDTEILKSNWQSIFAAASFLWSTSFNDYVALEYGIDVGFGVLFGDATRTEAYPSTGAGSHNGYAACNGPGDPASAAAGFCDQPTRPGTDLDGQDGAHYGIVARKWSSGGSVPNVVPWLALPRLALRIKPIKQIQIRIDTGFWGGIFFGGTLSYGF